MDGSYIIGGIILLCLGLYVTKMQIKNYKQGEQSEFGFDGKILAGGIGLILVGIALVIKYI